MRYNTIRKMDISNSEGISVSLFLQGCEHYCEGCFNPETWDYDGGLKWTEEIEEEFISLCKKSHIKTVSILGGEPFDQEDELIVLLKRIEEEVKKPIWVWTGYDYNKYCKDTDIIKHIDILIDGLFDNGLRDLTLKYRGSSNQRVIDVKKSLEFEEVILYEK